MGKPVPLNGSPIVERRAITVISLRPGDREGRPLDRRHFDKPEWANRCLVQNQGTLLAMVSRLFPPLIKGECLKSR